MSTDLTLEFLGEVRIELDGRDLTPILPEKGKALIAYLAVTGKVQNRSHLAGMFWGDRSEKAALNNLRGLLVKLKKEIGTFLQITRKTVAFIQTYPVDLDVETFEYALQRAAKEDGAARRAVLRDAVQLYRGDFLSNLEISSEPIYDEWVVVVRERLRQKILMGWESLVNVCVGLGDNEAGIRYAQRLLELDPWREESHRQLMNLYRLNGKRALALNQFEICRKVLVAEFGAEPAESTMALQAQILEMSEGEIPRSLVPAPDSETAVPFLAPFKVPHFSGRDADLDRIGDQLLMRNRRRVIALVGMGGIGKTALATMLAHDLRTAFPDGVLWANGATADPMTLAERWANAYGFDFSQIPSLEARTSALRSLLSKKESLLVFDDIANPSWVRQFIPDGDSCAILITTRSADHAHILNAQLEEVEVLSRIHGRHLLASIVGVERVADAPEAADQIYDLLQGLPLALIIAAKQVTRRRRSSLPWLLARLMDESSPINLADDYGAIRTSFSLSWNRLDLSQKRIFSLLAVFEGRAFSAPALAAVAEMRPFPAQDRLDLLVNLSLLSEVEEGWYQQHPLLKDYAREKLADDKSPFQNLVKYYLAFAHDHQQDFPALRREWENLSACIDQAHKLALWQTVIDYAQTLRMAWFTQGRYSEARQAMKRAHQASLEAGDRTATAHIYFDWGMACVEQSDYQEAEQYLTLSLNLFKKLGEDGRIAQINCELGRISLEIGQYETAKMYLKTSLSLWEKLENPAGQGLALYRLARVAYRNDDPENAVLLLHNALEIQLKIDDERGRLPVMRLLAAIAVNENEGVRDIDTAAEYYEKVLAIAVKIGDENERALAPRGLSIVWMERGALDKALAYGEEAENILARIGDRKSLAQIWRQLSKVRVAMGDYDLAQRLAEETLKISRDLHDRLLEGLVLYEIGTLYKKRLLMVEARNSFAKSSTIAKALNHDYLIKISQNELDSIRSN